MSDFDAVCFDLDGTLCVQDQEFVDLWDAAFELAGVDPAIAPADVADVDADAVPTVESPEAFYEELFLAAAREAGADVDRATATSVAEAYLEVHDPAAVSFRPGAREALAAARERGPVGLVTNGGEATQTAKLDALGVRDAFDAAVYCDPRAGVEPKPDPTPLRMALDRLGAAPGETLLVGDSLPADVRGAHDAGMRSAWVPVGDPEGDPEPEPTHRLDSMAAVAALLRR